MRRAGLAGVVVCCAALGLAACGSSPKASTPVTRTLPVTAALTAALLAAGAAGHGLPVADFTGLTKGLTFYAYESSPAGYWAGAQLVPSHSSMTAQVSVQDDGAYDLFTKSTATGSWTAYQDGLGTIKGAHCAVVVPASVRTLWGWSTTTPCGGAPNT